MSPRPRRRLPAGADIIDLKDPAKGALGALASDAIASCVAAIAGRAELSATVGDLPMEPATVLSAVRATAATGVDYVKLGLFPGGDARGCLRLLAEQARGVRLILVVFADASPCFDAIREAALIGASGVMLDTACKDGRSLLDHLSLDVACRFRGRSACRGSARGACRVAASHRRAASASARARSSRLSRCTLPGRRSRRRPRPKSL